MRALLPALCLLCASCISDQHSAVDLLTPELFHVYYTDGSGSSSGTLGGHDDPARFNSFADAGYAAWSFGLTWNLLSPPHNRQLEEIARELRVATALLVQAPVPTPTTVEGASGPPKVSDGPDINIAVHGGAQTTETVSPSPPSVPSAADDASSGNETTPQEVRLLGVAGEVWTQLLLALAALLAALGTYFTRNSLPILKQYTKQGRARRQEERDA